MAQNDPWQQMVGNPMDRMIALTAHEDERFAGKRLFVTLRDCIVEEHGDHTRLIMKEPRGTYYYVTETPEQIFELAGVPCPPTIKQKKAETSASGPAAPGS